MLNREQKNSLITFLTPTLESLGYECVEVEWDSQEHAVRIFINNAADKINFEDTVKVTRVLNEEEGFAPKLEKFLENLNKKTFAKEYRLEVSSPGVNRPLRTQTHFENCIGKLCEINLIDFDLGSTPQKLKKLTGLIHKVSHDGLELEQELDSQRDPIVSQIKFTNIDAAHLIYDWDSAANDH